MTDSKRLYERRQYHFEQLHKRMSKLLQNISTLRLLSFTLGIALTVFLYITDNGYLSGASLITATILFVYLVLKHQKVGKQRAYAQVLVRINEDAIKRVNGEWHQFMDQGTEFEDLEHPYGRDLDIVGRGSLFQWLNVAKTYEGRQAFAKQLMVPSEDISFIQKRQKAINELAGLVAWRQRFQGEGEMITGAIKDPGFLYAWLKKCHGFYLKNLLSWVVIIMPLVSIILLVGAFLFPTQIHFLLPTVCLVSQYLMLRYKRSERQETLDSIYDYRDQLAAYEQLLIQLEKQKFSSEYLIQLQLETMGQGGIKASAKINQLKKIADSISNRLNFFYSLFNILLLWDYRSMMALERWKTEMGDRVPKWFHAIGEVESLSSFATLRYDYPEWTMPKFNDQSMMVVSKRLAHPLLGKKGVPNDVSICRETKVLLITGSNMSGKSTLLRTVGINLVLAYAGAPVCASNFECAMMHIHSCMRVSDNLEQSISSFYAELLRIKNIVQASKKERVFFLLDEIFKGTNSLDRHTGAKMLLKQLSDVGAIGMVSTHDLELAAMETETEGRVRNYHFEEYYDKDQIRFDYRLRTGVSSTRNALYLIRLAGIDIDLTNQ